MPTAWRAYDAVFAQPWWFASVASLDAEGGGRFDLVEPRGTMYAASTIEAGVREKLGRRYAAQRYLPRGALNGMEVAGLDLSHLTPLADTTTATGMVTREIDTSTDYGLTRGWAERFDRAEFPGIRYRPRSTVGDHYAYAIFGSGGVPDPPLPFTVAADWRARLEQAGVVVRAVTMARAEVLRPNRD